MFITIGFIVGFIAGWWVNEKVENLGEKLNPLKWFKKNNMFKLPKIKMPKIKMPDVVGNVKKLSKDVSKEVGGKVKGAGKGIKKLNPFK